MGHEMSHVILRHGTNQASKSKLIELPAVLGSQVAGGSLVGQLTQLGIGLGANSVLLKFSRSAESQADLMGSHLMAEAGYNPTEMARFFQKLDAENGSRAPQFFSDHPRPRQPRKGYRGGSSTTAGAAIWQRDRSVSGYEADGIENPRAQAEGFAPVV